MIQDLVTLFYLAAMGLILLGVILMAGMMVWSVLRKVARIVSIGGSVATLAQVGR